MESKERYLSARQAAEALGVGLPTLYAYVSRGMIRSEETEGNPRARRYLAEDIRRLQERKEQRRHPEKAAESALHWGASVLESAMTLISEGRLFYRGQDAAELAVTRSVEQVAALLWTGDFAREADLFGSREGESDLPERCRNLLPLLTGIAPVEKFQALLSLAAADDLAAYTLTPEAVAQTGARILRMLTAIAAGEEAPVAGIAARLQRAWIPDQPRAISLLSAALVLCADHELNVSAFTARCVASTLASPYAAVIAGLSALQGVRHGGQTERVEILFREVAQETEVRSTLLRRLKRGETLPGFGHPLYPQGDPRGRLLLDLTARYDPESLRLDTAEAIVAEVADQLKEFPTIDFGLVALTQALGLPPGSPLTLFALGRTLGWIGHAIEQYRQDRLIRPRALYIGKDPHEI